MKDVESKKILFQAKNRLCAAKPQYYRQDNGLVFFDGHDVYAAQLDNAVVFGSSNVVVAGREKAIYELPAHDKKNKFRYSDTVALCFSGGKMIIRHKDSGKGIEEGIMLSANYSYNYYHFVCEILPKFNLLNEMHVPKSAPLLVDDVVADVPQFKELLDFFNAEGREIIYLKKGYGYKIKRLYYLSFINVIPPNYKDVDAADFTDFQFDTRGIDFLRNKLLRLRGPANHPKRIFLSRQNASRLRRYNEDEVINVFKKYDFEVVTLESWSISEQVSLFNNAEFIAGATGAAFTNIIFCSPNCKILCFQPKRNDISAFSTIAKYLRLDLQCLGDDEDGRRDIHVNFTIDVDKAQRVLADFLAN
ncbi:MAG: glycosyltransferase family 61 protein [Deltaproteobacteria bacterium]|nr:glycosyltransferase family 61 protein [Deltaproteobacteria bacterium]